MVLIPKSTFGSECELPSRGIPYGDKIPDGVVYVNPWGVEEQTLAAGAQPSQILRVIHTLIDRCTPTLSEVGLKATDLITADRVFLTIVTRAISYGAGFATRVPCPNCSSRVFHEFRPHEELHMYLMDPNYSEPFQTQLPMSQAIVDLRLLRGEDELDIERYKANVVRHAEGEIEGDPAYSYRWAKHITRVQLANGRTLVNKSKGDMGEVNAWYSSLHARDDFALRQAVSDQDCGLLLEETLVCKNCDSQFSAGLPLSVEFFRPNPQRKGLAGRTVGSPQVRRPGHGVHEQATTLATETLPAPIQGGPGEAVGGNQGQDKGSGTGDPA